MYFFWLSRCSKRSLIYVNPEIVLEYLAVFAGTMLLVFALIFIIELIIGLVNKTARVLSTVIYVLSIIFFLALGITTLYFNYATDNSTLKMVLIILIGVILIIAGALLIFYYAANPKFKIDQKVIYSEDGTSKVTIVKSDVYPASKKSKTKKISKNCAENTEKNEITEVK